MKFVLRADPTTHLLHYNVPTAAAVAVILPGSADVPSHHDIVLYKRSSLDPENRDIIRINETHPDYDPLHYALLRPHGDLGWTFTIKRDGKFVSTMEFYTYHLMVRSDFNVILRSGRLLQKYIVEQYAKVEQGRLNYVCHNQR